MTVILGIAAGLILLGLVMCFLCPSIKFVLLQKVVYYVGIAMVIIGLILLLAPVVIWVNNQLTAMLGAR